MKALLRCLACILAVTPLWAQSSVGGPSDEAAIRDVVKRYVDARGNRDPKAVEALFTSEADQLVSSGEWRRGREAVVRGTQGSSERNPGVRTITADTIRFLTNDVAIADGPYIIQSAAGNERRMWTTFVMKRGAEGWRIAAIRNMLPAGQGAR
jgi:uncharacterized protein (TIGR02246 family)